MAESRWTSCDGSTAANWLWLRLALVERATCVTHRRSSPMLSVTVDRLEAWRGHAARIGVRGFTCAHRGSGGRAARIGGPAGEKLEQMWKTLAILYPHRSMVRPRHSSLVGGILGTGMTYR